MILKYPVRAALNPFASTIGYLLPFVVSGSIIVSVVLSLPTVGPLLLRSLVSQDMLLASSIILLLGVLTVVGTFLSDLLLMWIDPRSGRACTDEHDAARSDERAAVVTEARRSRSPASSSSPGGASAATGWRWSARRGAALFYLVAVFADFLAYYRPARHRGDAQLHPAAGDPLVRRRPISAPRLRAQGQARSAHLQACPTRRIRAEALSGAVRAWLSPTTSSACSRPTGTCSA